MAALFAKFSEAPRSFEEEMLARRRSTTAEEEKKRTVVSRRDIKGAKSAVEEEDPIEIVSVSTSSAVRRGETKNGLKTGQAEVDEGENPDLARRYSHSVGFGGEINRVAKVDMGGTGQLMTFSVPVDALGHGGSLNQLLGVNTRTLRPDEIHVSFRSQSTKCLACDGAPRSTCPSPFFFSISQSFPALLAVIFRRAFESQISYFDVLLPLCIVLIPCSHIVLCFGCAISSLGKGAACPECDKPIREIFKINQL